MKIDSEFLRKRFQEAKQEHAFILAALEERRNEVDTLRERCSNANKFARWLGEEVERAEAAEAEDYASEPAWAEGENYLFRKRRSPEKKEGEGE